MNLKFLTEEFCPDCGAETVSISKDIYGMEYRTYGCRRMDEASIHGNRKIIEECPSSKMPLAQYQKRNKLRANILELIEDSDADQDYKDKMTHWVITAYFEND